MYQCHPYKWKEVSMVALIALLSVGLPWNRSCFRPPQHITASIPRTPISPAPMRLLLWGPAVPVNREISSEYYGCCVCYTRDQISITEWRNQQIIKYFMDKIGVKRNIWRYFTQGKTLNMIKLYHINLDSKQTLLFYWIVGNIFMYFHISGDTDNKMDYLIFFYYFSFE